MASRCGRSHGDGDEIVLAKSKKIKYGEGDFEKFYRLGGGGLGNVCLVQKRGGNDHGKTFAYKEMTKANVSKKAKRIEYARTERQVLEEVLGYNFIVQLHYAFQTSDKLVLVTEFANGGALREQLLLQGSFDEPEVRFWAAEITLALQCLHKLDVVHRDLKPENIWLDSENHIVLTDFSVSKKFKASNVNKRTYSYCGTPLYMSPEVATQRGHSFETDFWGLGVVVYELLTGRTPFGIGDRSPEAVTRRIINHNIGYSNVFSDNSKDFVQKLLWPCPSWRLGSGGFDDVKSHPFFKAIDWERLENKEIRPPFIPGINHHLDLSIFDHEAVDSPIEISEHIPPVIGNHMFENFDYVAPWVLQEEHEEGDKALFVDAHDAVMVVVNEGNQTDCVYEMDTLIVIGSNDISTSGFPLNGGAVEYDLHNVCMADDGAPTEHISDGLDNGAQQYGNEIFFVEDFEYNDKKIA